MDLDFDPRDLERDETRDIDMPWIELGRGPVPPAKRTILATATRTVAIVTRANETPMIRETRSLTASNCRGPEREIVFDGDHPYELNGEDSRTLATVGAFRVVAEGDLRDPRDESSHMREPDLRHLRDEGLTSNTLNE